MEFAVKNILFQIGSFDPSYNSIILTMGAIIREHHGLAPCCQPRALSRAHQQGRMV
jgi:hypothetical protein